MLSFAPACLSCYPLLGVHQHFHSFLLLKRILPRCEMNIPHFVSPFTSGWRFELFPILVITDNAARNVYMQVFLWTCFCFSWVDSQEWNAGSLGKLTFTFLRNCHTVFQSLLDFLMMYVFRFFFISSLLLVAVIVPCTLAPEFDAVGKATCKYVRIA